MKKIEPWVIWLFIAGLFCFLIWAPLIWLAKQDSMTSVKGIIDDESYCGSLPESDRKMNPSCQK